MSTPTAELLPMELPRQEVIHPMSRPVGGAVLGAITEVEPVASNATLECFLQIPDMRIDAGEGSYTTQAFDGKVTVLANVLVSGRMTHGSRDTLDGFEKGRGSRNGKFGKDGTYFALGNLPGDTVEELAADFEKGQVTYHQANIRGNFLLLDRADANEVYLKMREEAGLPKQKMISRMMQDVGDVANKFAIDGQPIDGVIIMMTKDDPSAEMFVLSKSADKVHIKHRIANGEKYQEVDDRISFEYRLPRDVLENGRDRLSPELGGIVDNYLQGRPQLEAETRERVMRYAWRGTNNEFQRQGIVGAMGGIMNADVGLEVGYTLGEHTQMVLSIFDSQFAHRLMDVDDEYNTNLAEVARLTLLMQDIGKPIAVQIHGDKSKQMSFNHDFALSYMEGMDIGNEMKLAVSELIGQDILGEYFKKNAYDIRDRGLGIERAVQDIQMLAGKIGIETVELLEVLKVIYMCDAGAYTQHSEFIADNGSHQHGKNLDYLFEKGPTTDKIGFAEKQARQLKRLQDALWQQSVTVQAA